jgi:hypothetical protein
MPDGTKRKRKAEMKNVRKNFGGLTSVAAIQALPADFNAFRIPSITPQRTSTLKFMDERPFAINQQANGFAMVLRAPTRQLWLTKTIPATLAASAYYKRDYVSTNKSQVPIKVGDSMDVTGLLQLESNTATAWNLTNSSAEYLPNYPLAVDRNNGVWFYFPTGGAKFIVEFDTDVNMSGGRYTWTFEVCQNFTTSNAKTFTVQGGTNADEISATVTASLGGSFHGFIRPVLITCNADVSGNGQIEAIRCGVTTNGSLRVPEAANAGPSQYTPSPYFDPPADTEAIKTASAPFSDTRVCATSVLFMNETRVFGKEGHVNGLRINCKSAYSVFSTTLYTGYDSIYGTMNEREKYGGPLEKGLYMYSRPDDLSLEFRDWTNSPKVEGQSVIRLDAFDFIDVIRFMDKNSADDTNITAVITYHIEWRNTSVLWPTGVQRMPHEAWRQAIASLSEIRHYSENPIHFRDILRRIGSAIKWAAPIVAPYAKQAAFSLARAALL